MTEHAAFVEFIARIWTDWFACVFIVACCVGLWLLVRGLIALGPVRAIETPTYPKDLSRGQLSQRRHIRDVVLAYLNYSRRIASDPERSDVQRARAEEEVRWTSWVIKTLFPGSGWD